jgi:hypothetical protein
LLHTRSPKLVFVGRAEIPESGHNKQENLPTASNGGILLHKRVEKKGFIMQDK